MSLALFVSDYPGTVDDATKALLLDNGASGSTIPDLWISFLSGYTGALSDRQREFLIDYLSVADVGQTLDDLWGAVSGPYTP